MIRLRDPYNALQCALKCATKITFMLSRPLLQREYAGIRHTCLQSQRQLCAALLPFGSYRRAAGR